MSNNIIVTEYVEDTKVAQLLLDQESVRDHEEFSQGGPEAVVVTFEEPMHSPAPVMPIGMPEVQILEVGDEIGDVTEFEEEHDELMDKDDQGVMGFSSPGHNGLPGAADYVDDDEVEEEEEPNRDWVNDRNPEAFMSYVLDAYPGGIPKHNGDSISKGEKVVQYLNRLNGEISEALRNDRNDCLDIDTLERMRVNMIRDTALMKRHIKKLQRRHRESIAGLNEETSLIKEATTPRIQMIMTPFERAVTGILINSVVSAGKPFEEVYDYLNKKYSFTPREELAIMQLATDMGQPIFKDRGTYGVKHSENDFSNHGVDFIKNYFA
jgi:hypothetical protein